jgi:hypothetical protein
MAKQRQCKCGCGKVITGHPNKKFFNKKHKDKYWNRVNPRGLALQRGSNIYYNPYSLEPEDIEDSMHPGDPHCFGD